MRYLVLFSISFLIVFGSPQFASAKSAKTWLVIKLENPGTLTKDEVNLIQMNMIKLEELPAMYYTAVGRYDMEKAEITKPRKIFKFPMHHDGYVFLKVKPASYIFTEGGQIDTYKICYKSFDSIFTPKEGAVNFLGVIDRNQIIKNVETFSQYGSQSDIGVTPTLPSQDEIGTLKRYMATSKKLSRIKGDVIAVEPQKKLLTKFTKTSIKKLNCQ